MQDIRDLGHLVVRWPDDPDFVFTRTPDPHTETGYRLYLAKTADFVVLGSFPSVVTAAAAIQNFKQLETEPPGGYLHPQAGWISGSWSA